MNYVTNKFGKKALKILKNGSLGFSNSLSSRSASVTRVDLAVGGAGDEKSPDFPDLHKIWDNNNRKTFMKATKSIFLFRVYTIICSLPTLLLLSSCVAPMALPRLTQQQMLEDYDELVLVMKNVFPAYELNKAVYGIDIFDILAYNRTLITGNETNQEFAKFINNTLMACKGSHLSLTDALYENTPLQQYSPWISKSAIKMNHEYMELFDVDRKSSFELLYYDGNYYSRYDFEIDNIQYSKGMRLVSIDGLSPDEILIGLQGYLSRYDYKNKRFFAPAISLKLGDNFYVYMYNKRQPTIFRFMRENGDLVQFDLSKNQTPSYKRRGSQIFKQPKMVFFIADHGIIYIRIPTMNPADIEYYREKIFAMRSLTNIKAVVLDIRYNQGGSDDLWQNIISCIIDKEILFTEHYAIRNNDFTKAYLKQAIELDQRDELFLHLENKLLKDSDFCRIDSQKRITLDKNSLKLDVPIYLVTHDVYSSAGSLLGLAQVSSRIISVGEPNSTALGRGITPFMFSLPNSKLIFSIEPLLDITNTKTLEDSLHVDVDVFVSLTLAEALKYNSDSVPSVGGFELRLLDLYENKNAPLIENYLRQHDPFFRTILELQKHE